MIIFEKDDLGRSIVEIIIKNSGSIYSRPGVAYFLTHIFNTKGTKDKKEKFYSLIEKHAIELHASVNREFLSISLKFLNKKETLALKYLKELLTSPNITQESIDKSISEIKAKIENRKNDNDYIASINLYKQIFKNTPLEYPILYEKIDEITLQEIKEFYNTLFQKEIIVLNGGKKVTLDAVISLFSPKQEKDQFFKPKKSKDVYYKKEVKQSFIHFASPFEVDYHKSLHLAKIATFILGSGGFGSRIMEEIRVKRGYAYSAYATNNFKKSYKLLSGYLQTKLENTDDAIRLVKNIIKDFQTNGITQEELDQAKRFLIGSEPLRSETLSQRLLKKFNEVYLNLDSNYYQKELDLIKKTSKEEINNFLLNHNELNEITFSIVTDE